MAISETSKTKKEPKDKIVKTKKEPKKSNSVSDKIKDLLNKEGFRRYEQPSLPKEENAAYIKDDCVVIVSMTQEVNSTAIQSIKVIHKVTKGMKSERDKTKEI
jgi:hypothetical protein